jgi:hypothetical protein
VTENQDPQTEQESWLESASYPPRPGDPDPAAPQPVPLHGGIDYTEHRLALPAPTPRPYPTVTETLAEPHFIPTAPPIGPAAAPAAAPSAEDVRLTLWGGSSSGKTTFLGVLPLAIQQAWKNPRYGPWNLIPNDERTLRFQTRETARLDTDRVFAPKTSALEPGLSWTLRGRIHEKGLSSVLRGTHRVLGKQPQDMFTLRVPDVPGEWYRAESLEALEKNKEILTQELAGSHGIVYLFDPVAELDASNSYQYLQEMLARLKMRVQEQKRMRGQYLPQSIAVCVTKFDTKWIFERALEAHLVKQDRHGQPTVLKEDAEAFFDLLCRTLGPSGQHVSDAIKSAFDPKRTLFFVTSAVGFRRGANGTGYDMAQPSQINPAVGGAPRIMDQIRPINVLEPLVEIERLSRLGGPR